DFHVTGVQTCALPILVKDIPQLRIALSPEFFKELFSEEVDSASLSTEAGFNNHVKGLYLTVAASEMTGIGGLVTFQGVANKTGRSEERRVGKEQSGRG